MEVLIQQEPEILSAINSFNSPEGTVLVTHGRTQGGHTSYTGDAGGEGMGGLSGAE